MISSSALRCHWNKALIKLFLELCVDQIRLGERLTDNSGFKSAVLNKILEEFNVRQSLIEGYTHPYKKANLSSKYAELKSIYKVFFNLKDNSGFGWDEGLNMPTAPDSVWNTYLAAYPEAAKYRNQPPDNWILLEYVYGGKIPTGAYASDTTQVLPANTAPNQYITPTAVITSNSR
jgi:hypothetical protein